METWEWLLFALAAVLIIGVIVVSTRSRRRTIALQRHFGTEYDRTVDRAESRRDAELDLRQRTRERDSLELRALSPAAAFRYQEQWTAIQGRFVDAPSRAVADAAVLLKQVMTDRGYPEDFDEHVGVISVDHPRVVEDYRVADEVRAASAAGLASTEELREALVRYRSLFEDLIVSDDVAARDLHERAEAEARHARRS